MNEQQVEQYRNALKERAEYHNKRGERCKWLEAIKCLQLFNHIINGTEPTQDN